MNIAKSLTQASRARRRGFFLVPGEKNPASYGDDWDGEEKWRITIYVGDEEGILRMRRLLAHWTLELDRTVGSGESLELEIDGVGKATDYDE